MIPELYQWRKVQAELVGLKGEDAVVVLYVVITGTYQSGISQVEIVNLIEKDALGMQVLMHQAVVV